MDGGWTGGMTDGCMGEWMVDGWVIACWAARGHLRALATDPQKAWLALSEAAPQTCSLLLRMDHASCTQSAVADAALMQQTARQEASNSHSACAWLSHQHHAQRKAARAHKQVGQPQRARRLAMALHLRVDARLDALREFRAPLRRRKLRSLRMDGEAQTMPVKLPAHGIK
eukprot:365043-Chlamydomonas_euryale.AAC.20